MARLVLPLTFSGLQEALRAQIMRQKQVVAALDAEKGLLIRLQPPVLIMISLDVNTSARVLHIIIRIDWPVRLE